MSRKAILFDLDGTLTDSGEGIINCAILALEHFGLPVPSREDLRVFVGPPLRDSFINHGVPADKAEEAIAVYRSRYIPIGKFENTPYPGIRELLDTLQKEGHKLYIATSKPEGMSKDILEHFGLAQYFTLICGAASDGLRNTKEAVIEYLLAQLESRANLVMVGDTIYDVHGATHHGIPCIAVTWGYGIADDMKKAGASIAATMDDLYRLLK